MAKLIGNFRFSIKITEQKCVYIQICDKIDRKLTQQITWSDRVRCSIETQYLRSGLLLFPIRRKISSWLKHEKPCRFTLWYYGALFFFVKTLYPRKVNNWKNKSVMWLAETVLRHNLVNQWNLVAFESQSQSPSHKAYSHMDLWKAINISRERMNERERDRKKVEIRIISLPVM